MKKAGVEIVTFTNPRMHFLDFVNTVNYRNHRKVVVIDGKIGYTGGMNINDRYFKKWRDTHLRITGKAVASLQYTFLDSWLTGKGRIDRNMTEYYPMVQGITAPAGQAVLCPGDDRRAALQDPGAPGTDGGSPLGEGADKEEIYVC